MKSKIHILSSLIIAAASILSGCSPKNSPPAVVKESHTSVNMDSVTGIIVRMLQSQQTFRQSEQFNRTERTRETTVINEHGDTTRHDTHTEINTEYISSLEREAKVLRQENDSLRHIKSQIDSVAVPVPYKVEIPVPVERELSAWEKTRLKTWWWLATALAIGLIHVIRVPLKSLARKIIGKS